MYHIKMKKAELTDRAQKAAMYGIAKAAYYFRDYVKSLIGIYMFGEHSQPGDPPYIQTGDLRRSIRVALSRDEAYVYTDSPYWEYLEYGTWKMAPRPFWRRAIAETRSDLQRIMKDSMKSYIKMNVEEFGDEDDRDSYREAKQAFFS